MDHLPFSSDFPVVVGPMVGISHVAFRSMLRRLTPKEIPVLSFTEMLSTRRLPSEKLASTFELKTFAEEKTFIPQLLGNEERFIAPSLEKLSLLKPSGIDINMGCPASQILKHNWGVRLMQDPEYARSVVKMTRRHTSLPLSVKLRAGFEKTMSVDELSEFCSGLFDAGADWLTVHARAASCRHTGTSDWGLIAAVSAKLNKPILVNGDIQSSNDIIYILKTLQAPGVVLGRAVTATPWILWEAGYVLGLTTKKPPLNPSEKRRCYFDACTILIEELKIYGNSDEHVMERFRFFGAIGARWFSFGHSWWKETTKAKTIEALKHVIKKYTDLEDFTHTSRIVL